MFKEITLGNKSYAIETDQELINKSNLGKRPQMCKICSKTGDFQTWECYELLLGYRDVFRYFECPYCMSLQIEKIPDNMDKYYPSNYYSYIAQETELPDKDITPIPRRLLDIGCGTGKYLCAAAAQGNTELFGCDPYIDKDIEYPNGVRIYKRSVFEMEGSYNIIRLSHTFEHMAEPNRIFAAFDRLLGSKNADPANDPFIYIEIPIFPNTEFDIFGPYWINLDAPRHFFIHSVKSIRLLAYKHGFYISKTEYPYKPGKFFISRLYQLGARYWDIQQMESDGFIDYNSDMMRLYEEIGLANIKYGKPDVAEFILRRR